MISLKIEIQEIKKNNKSSGINKEYSFSVLVKEKHFETENENSEENILMTKTSFNHNESKHTTSNLKEKKVKENKKNKFKLSCSSVNNDNFYVRKKPLWITKQSVSEQQVKECQKNFLLLCTFMHKQQSPYHTLWASE